MRGLATSQMTSWGKRTSGVARPQLPPTRARVLPVLLAATAVRARYCFTDSFGIGSISLAPLDIAFHATGLHQPDLMAEFGQFARPVMRAGAGFDANQAGR